MGGDDRLVFLFINNNIHKVISTYAVILVILISAMYVKTGQASSLTMGEASRQGDGYNSVKQGVRNCGAAIINTLRMPLVSSRLPSRILQEVGRTAFYPMVLVARGIKITNSLLQKREPLNFTGGRKIRHEIFNMAGFLALFLATQGSSITYDRFDRAVDSHVSRESVVVVVNGFPKSDPLYAYVEHRYAALYGDLPRAYKVSAQTWIEAVEEISEISRKENRKIDQVEIHGHGLPGQFSIMADAVQPGSVGLFKDAAVEHNIPVVSDEGVRNNDTKLCGVFKPGARVSLFSCSAARGVLGDELMQKVGSFLLDKGGQVDGVTVTLVTNIPEQVFIAKGLSVPDGAGKLNKASEAVFSFVYMLQQGLDHMRDPDYDWYFTAMPVKHMTIQVTPTTSAIAGL